ncbi:catalase [Halalkalibacillus halophilus]|uniref:catalase n=1 Tax=Halalkalibacillus halophilus TaxID=392827 RepID=UPI0003F775ED|nr:catalase [Halalkalibacillus halophilus]
MENNKDNQSNRKKEQLEEYTQSDAGTKHTTDQGIPIHHDETTLKVGERGPSLIEDFHFREKITHFDHERIPERVVHARGFGAHGYFQVYEPLSDLTKAGFLNDTNVKTPVFVRFSTVVGSRGSADTVRDVRGFATKFYTKDGNFDLVGNNMPIFFIQDAIKFPDLVHAIKPEPNNEIPQASAAHDTFWDWVVNNQESAHMIMWLLSDRGIPRSFRMMDGFGVHTFRFVNSQNEAHFVKFHWKPLLGVHSLIWDEAQKIAGKDPDFHRKDLYEAIERGDYPEYELAIQVLTEREAQQFNIDLLDATKIWPEEQVPLQRIGKMTLNRNQDNFFAETEQAAFHLANIVPGIDFTNDPLLQGRLFSYLDTQLLRLGGPNFHEIPINRPIIPIHNNQRDGFHRMTINKGKVAYSPNTLQMNSPEMHEEKDAFMPFKEHIEGIKTHKLPQSFSDHFSQARLFYYSLSSVEKKHIIDAFHFEVGNVNDPSIKQKVVTMFNQVDHQLAVKIANGVGVKQPEETENQAPANLSPALSQLNTPMKLKGRKVAFLLENGFNHKEVADLKSFLEAKGIVIDIVSEQLGAISSDQETSISANKNYATTHAVLYDAIFIPSGEQHVKKLNQTMESKEFILNTFHHMKTIGSCFDANQLVNQQIKPSFKDSSIKNSEVGIIQLDDQLAEEQFLTAFSDAIKVHRHWKREV